MSGPEQWFDDIAPLPAGDRSPGHALADHLKRTRLATEAGSDLTAFADSARPARADNRAPQEWETLFEPPPRPREPSGRFHQVRRIWDHHRLGVLGSAAAVVVVVVSVLLVAALTGDDSGPAPAVAAASSSTTPGGDQVSAHPLRDCPSRTRGSVTTGNDPGDQRSGPGVIKAFNHAYYVTRSAHAARAVALSSAVQPEPVLQSYIDSVRPGSWHCLEIIGLGAGTYRVRLSVYPPTGNVPIVYPQIIRIATLEGKSWIASISKDE